MQLRLRLVFCLTILAAAFPACSKPRALSTNVYVWQPVSGDPMREAIQRAAPFVDTFYLHAADLSFRTNGPKITEFKIDWSMIRSVEKPVGLVVRIPHAEGGLGSSREHALRVADLARKLLAEARAAGVICRDFQIDYDCPESRLPFYLDFLNELKPLAGAIPLSFTALPTWLKHPEFPALARMAGRYVLQVHSLRLPQKGDAEAILCEVKAAKRAAAEASKLGVPFEIALPTYRCVVALDANGNRLAVISEGEVPNFPEGTQFIAGAADAREIAEWVTALRIDPPRNCTGLIWYRLPVDSDRMNWPWPTFRAVIRGQTTAPLFSVVFKTDLSGSTTVEIHNQGEGSGPLPRSVTIKWRTGSLEGADGVKGYAAQSLSGENACEFTRTDPDAPNSELPPGKSQVIGWIRVREGDSLEAVLHP